MTVDTGTCKGHNYKQVFSDTIPAFSYKAVFYSVFQVGCSEEIKKMGVVPICTSN